MVEEVDTIFLTDQEVQRLYELDLPTRARLASVCHA